MPTIGQLLNRRLSLADSLLVLVALAAVVGLSYAAYSFVFRKVLEARVRSAFPRVCKEARLQREQLVAAIEDYKSKLGFYPPDHVLSRNPFVIDAATNQLLYELAGTVYDPTNETFTAKDFEKIEKRMIKELFSIDGFKNSAASPEQVKRFLSAEPVPSMEVHDDPDISVLAFSRSFEGIDSEVAWEFAFSSWQYVSTAPTNNPVRFDLWIEIKADDKTNIIGNWKEVE